MDSFVATIGFFDGVHIGHQYLLATLRSLAVEQAMKSAVITFGEHPLRVLQAESKPLLTTTNERLNLLKQQQLDEIFCFNFDVIKDFTAAEFLRILHDRCGVKVLLMGYDHRFGADSPLTHEQYTKAATEASVKLVWSDEYRVQGSHISSTQIRNLLAQTNIAEANRLLGYSYSLTGEVVHGNKIGRKLGFPTANISVSADKLIPHDGVYAVDVHTEDNRSYKGILNIGLRPTIGTNQHVLEVHILDCDTNLYGQKLTICFRRFIRLERKFDTLEQLQQQITEDLSHL